MSGFSFFFSNFSSFSFFLNCILSVVIDKMISVVSNKQRFFVFVDREASGSMLRRSYYKDSVTNRFKKDRFFNFKILIRLGYTFILPCFITIYRNAALRLINQYTSPIVLLSYSRLLSNSCLFSILRHFFVYNWLIAAFFFFPFFDTFFLCFMICKVMTLEDLLVIFNVKLTLFFYYLKSKKLVRNKSFRRAITCSKFTYSIFPFIFCCLQKKKDLFDFKRFSSSSHPNPLFFLLLLLFLVFFFCPSLF